jgi:hypothetical protein
MTIDILAVASRQGKVVQASSIGHFGQLFE